MSSLSNRRAFLKTLGVGVPAIAVPILRASPLLAQGNVSKRFVGIFTPNGTIPDSWRPQGNGTTFTIAAGAILEPVAKHKAKLNILWGVHYLAADRGPGAAHQKGAGAALTARPLGRGNMNGGNNSPSGYATGISVDQHLANKLGPKTRLPSIEMGLMIDSGGNRRRLSYAGPNQPLAPESDPAKNFARLFSGLAPTAGPMAGPTGPSEEETARLLQDRKSVLDKVTRDLERLSARLPGSEKARLEGHLDSLRDLERQIAPSPSAGVACKPPEMGGTIDPRSTANYPKLSRLQLEIIFQAFSCDQTRIATLMYNGSTSQQTFPFLGISGKHHDVSHRGDGDRGARDYLIKVNRFYAEELNYLLERMDSVADPNGKTMLDNSIVAWTNELGKGNNHTRKNVPWVVAGSAGGYFKTGQFLEQDGRDSADLLLSFCHGMGLVDEKTFGLPDFCKGPLPGMAA